MRISYLTHYAALYGANRSLLDLMLELRRRGAVAPHVLLPLEGPITERLRTEGIPFDVIPWQPWMSERHYMGRLHHRIAQHLRHARAAQERAATNKALLPEVMRILMERRAEAVHVNSAAVGITGLLQQAVHVPVIWHIREMPERQYLLHIDQGRRHYGRALRRATHLIAISKAVQEDIRRYAGAVNSTLIYNGVLDSRTYAELAAHADERWERTDPFTFLLAGLIHPSKGQAEAIEAFARLQHTHPRTRLVIAGDGKADHLRALIAEHGLHPKVELTGFVKDIRPLLLQAHTLLMCSRNEAMGRITVEGMGSGLPVIGHASGGTVEIVQEGRNGLLYPGGAEALADRMAALVGDVGRARALGLQAMRDAVERFSVERYAGEVLEVYRSVLSRANA